MEISEGIHLVPSVRWSRIYLIEDETLTLVDTGMPWSARHVFNYIESIGRRHEDLRLILMTHNHPDHTSGALSISKRTGAEIVAHSHDTKTHSDQRHSLDYLGVFGSLDVPIPFFQRTPVGRLLKDGDILPLMGGIHVIHTPGHTPGSVCYLLEKRGVMFSGDTIFSNGERISRSIPFPGYDGSAYRQSLQKLAGLEFDILCGGHGVPLVGHASDKLRELLEVKADPPSWRELLFKRIPRRLTQAKSLSGEDH